MIWIKHILRLTIFLFFGFGCTANLNTMTILSNQTPQTTALPHGERITLPSVTLTTSYHGRIVYTYRGLPYVINLDTGEHFRYEGGRLMIFPKWHPSGEFFVTGEGDIELIDFTTGAITTLAPGRRPTWHPDGNLILYNFGNNAPSATIFDISTQSITQAETTTGIPIINADWSSDGQYIVFATGGSGFNGVQVLVIEANCIQNTACSPTQITFNNDVMSRNQTPQWSPDGEQIVFVSNRDGFYAIYIMNADGSNQQPLTRNPLGDYQPTWSPDGQYIAFRRVDSQLSTIYIMRPDGSEVTQLFEYPAWDPDWWMPTEDTGD
jgi:Tol biopolymer transport system component